MASSSNAEARSPRPPPKKSPRARADRGCATTGRAGQAGRPDQSRGQPGGEPAPVHHATRVVQATLTLGPCPQPLSQPPGRDLLPHIHANTGLPTDPRYRPSGPSRPANGRRANSSPRWTHRSRHFAQQPRSNSAMRSPKNHHAPALLLCCDGLLRKALWWASWWGSLDGMQGVRGSNPLSSTRHNALAGHPLRAIGSRAPTGRRRTVRRRCPPS